MLFKIYTEDTNANVICDILDTYFDGYSYSHQYGVYKGKREHSLVIDIVAPPYRATDVELACEDIRRVNKQESVLMVAISADYSFVGKE